MGVFTDGILSPQIFREAAAIMAGRPDGGPEPQTEAIALLAALGYRPGNDSEAADAVTAANRQALLRLAAQLRMLFRLSPPDSPNLVFLGGEADTGPVEGDDGPHDTVSLAGAGLTLNEAFERCVGEGVEYLSQMAAEADIVCRGRPSDVPHGLRRGVLSEILAMLASGADVGDLNIDWVAGRCLASADPILLPADLCLRRSESERDSLSLVNVGTGCAGGPTEEAATIAAILELIERDAAALWWRGGRPARPISLEAAAAAGAGELLRHVRGSATTRHSWLLDITTDLGIPCVASVSLASDGSGFACGLSAGLAIGPAIRSAIVEMCQMELSHQIIALKRRQPGNAALNRHDLAQLERARLVDANTPAIQSKGLPNDWYVSSDNSSGAELSFECLLRRFEELGVNIYVVNLTRNLLAIPVSKVIATELQPYPSKIETPRLTKTIEQCGKRNISLPRVPLL